VLMGLLVYCIVNLNESKQTNKDKESQQLKEEKPSTPLANLFFK